MAYEEDIRFSKDLCWMCRKPILDHPKGKDGFLRIGYRCPSFDRLYENDETKKKLRRLNIDEKVILDIEEMVREILGIRMKKTT